MSYKDAYKALQKLRKEGAEERARLQAELESAEDALRNCEFYTAKRAINDTQHNLGVFNREFDAALAEAERVVKAQLPAAVGRLWQQLDDERNRLQGFGEFYTKDSREEIQRRVKRIGEAFVRWKREVRLAEDPVSAATQLRDWAIGDPDKEPLYVPEELGEYTEEERWTK